MSQQGRFRARLQEEFDSRREKNQRYSLRAFAAFLGADHSSLSQMLRGSRRVPVASIRAWGRKLGLDAAEVAAYIAAEHLPDPEAALRQEQLRQWTAESHDILTGRVHWEILRLLRSPGFRPDCRWIAQESGSSVDEVNLALSRLLRLRLLEFRASGEWVDLTGLPELTERAFRKLALNRVREKTSKWQIP